MAKGDRFSPVGERETARDLSNQLEQSTLC
jgi:hypothetical protein